MNYLAAYVAGQVALRRQAEQFADAETAPRAIRPPRRRRRARA